MPCYFPCSHTTLCGVARGFVDYRYRLIPRKRLTPSSVSHFSLANQLPRLPLSFLRSQRIMRCRDFNGSLLS
jgi:hypothetical protein